MIDRRDVLAMLGLGPLSLAAPLGLLASPARAEGASPARAEGATPTRAEGATPTRAAGAIPAHAAGATGQTLVLVELKGGNDGLNTVVPYADPAYYALRPRLAIPRDKVLGLDGALGLHPALAPLMPLWQGREMAIALGVGYPQPNRSHFRSIEIWETASRSNQVLNSGWIDAALVPTKGRARPADGVVLGGRSLGPLSGHKLRALILDRPERFLRQAGRMKAMPARSDNPALAHILKVRDQTLGASAALKELLTAAPAPKGDFPPGRFGRGLAVAAKLILAGSSIPVLHVALTGFDTHTGQAGRHERLLAKLGSGLAAFQGALKRGGAWDRVMVMTYSEFGRRAHENGSGGTDHGTAAPHLILGGRVKGGFFGRQPGLADLAAGDLRHTVDFRSLYATVQQRWWRQPSRSTRLASFAPLDFLA
jgi:uncharacterized protein (DUF1501 family)